MSLPEEMRALRLEAVNCLAETRVPVPRPRADEVLIRTVATTICTSDLNDIAHNPFGIVLPRVLGHEGAGVVAALGEEVAGIRLGDEVTAHPVIPCRNCANCRRGLGHLCSNMGHLGLDREGTFAEFFCIRADRVRRLPPGVDFRFASLLEPVAVCLEAVERARISGQDNVLVIGDGPFGILIARLAAARHPGRVVLLGRHDFRLRQVSEAVTINEKTSKNVMEAIRAATGGEGMDAAILASGSPSAVELGLASLRARGRLVQFSAVHEPPRMDWFRVHTQELEILGACNDQERIDPALACLADAALCLNDLVTHHLPFPEWRHGFRLAREGKDEALKVALVFEVDS